MSHLTGIVNLKAHQIQIYARSFASCPEYQSATKSMQPWNRFGGLRKGVEVWGRVSEVFNSMYCNVASKKYHLFQSAGCVVLATCHALYRESARESAGQSARQSVAQSSRGSDALPAR